MNTQEDSKIYDFVGRAKGSGLKEDRQQHHEDGSGEGTSFSFPTPTYDLVHIHIAQAALAVKDKTKSETEARNDLVEGHASKFKGILADEGKAIVGRVKHLEVEIDHVEEAIDSEANELASTSQGDFQQVQTASLDWTWAAVVETTVYGVMFLSVLIWGGWANFSYFHGAGATIGGDAWGALGLSLMSFFAGSGFKYLHSRETDPARKKGIGTLTAVIGMVGVACFYASTGMSEAADAGISSQSLFQGTGEETSGFSIAANILKPIGQVLAEVGLGFITFNLLIESLAGYGKTRTVSEFVPNPVFLALKAKYETNKRAILSLQGEKKHLEEWISAQEKLIAGRLAEVTAQFQYQLSN